MRILRRDAAVAVIGWILTALLWVVGIAVALMIAASCAPAKTFQPPAQNVQLAPDSVKSVQLPDTVTSVREIGVDSAFRDFFALYRTRLAGHSTLPDLESPMCLYGVVRGDTADVVFMRPARIVYANATMAAYQECPQPRAQFFGELRYLGMHHSHNPPGMDCRFSLIDDRSFAFDHRSLLELLSCSQGLVARVRR